MKVEFQSLYIKNIVKETDDCVSVEFDVPESIRQNFAYKAGQYLTFKKMIDGAEIRRSYSLCSAPHENIWKVAIKQVYQGKFSSFANKDLKVGDVLEVMKPSGNFILKEDFQNKNFALFAAGSGITPVISLAKTMLNQGHGSVTLIYGNKGFNEIIFREELESLKNMYMNRFRIIHVFSRESLGNSLQKGRIDDKKTSLMYDAFLKLENIHEVYSCGPESMILGINKALIDKGFDEKNIHFELFGTSTQKKEEELVVRDELAAKVEVVLDNDSTAFDLNSNGVSILDAAQKFGADLPFACKGGVCCTCKAKVLEGKVEMDINYALTPEEVSQGYVLTCQSHPISKFVKISFDD